MTVYLDASAFVKTIIEEPESLRLTTWLRDHPQRASSAILRVEAVRTAWRHGLEAAERAKRELETVMLVDVTTEVLRAAGDLLPGAVRSLEAIHLATARTIGEDIEALVTYDDRMAGAAADLGLPTAAP